MMRYLIQSNYAIWISVEARVYKYYLFTFVASGCLLLFTRIFLCKWKCKLIFFELCLRMSLQPAPFWMATNLRLLYARDTEFLHGKYIRFYLINKGKFRFENDIYLYTIIYCHNKNSIRSASSKF